MKKGDLVAMSGKNRPWYDTAYTPLVTGKVVKVAADSVEIYWDYAKTSATYPIDKVTDHAKSKKGKDGKTYNRISIERVKE